MDYMNQENKKQTEYNEISLADYIKIIFKRKTLILIFLLAGLIIAGGITFLLPKTYQIETYLEIGNYGKRMDNKISLELVDSSYIIESSYNIVKKIEAGFYGDYSGIEAKNFQKTNLVKIEITSESPEEAKKNLEDINKSILNEYNQKIEAKREILENSIKELEEKIDFLLSKNKEVENLELEIFNIQRRIDDVQPTKVIKEPIVISEKKPSLTFNLIFGGLLGIFVGVVLAFGKEWWKENKSRI